MARTAIGKEGGEEERQRSHGGDARGQDLDVRSEQVERRRRNEQNEELPNQRELFVCVFNGDEGQPMQNHSCNHQREILMITERRKSG